MGGLLGGKQKSSSTSTTKVDVPAWALGPLQQALGMAVDASEIPYESYSDPRFADFNQDELNSFSSIRGLQNQWNPAFQNANNVLGQVANTGLNGFSQQQLDQYMNPYMTNVMDIQKGRSLDQFDSQMKDFRGRAAQAGAFGGSRFGLGEAQMYEDFSRQLSENETMGLASAYESALSGAERGITRAGTAALSQADLATQAQAMGYSDASQLNQIGGQQRALDQAGLDFDYEQWLNEKAYPYNQASFLAGIAGPIAGQVSGSTATQTQTTGGGNKLGSIMGLASMAAAPFTGGASLMGGLGSMGSLASSFGAGMSSLFNGTMGMSPLTSAGYLAGKNMTGLPSWNPGYARGGQVRGYAEGGAVQSEGPAWVTSKYSPIKYGNDLAEWAIENPMEAAGWGLTALPLVGPAARGIGWAGKALGLGAKAATKVHPKLLVGALGAGTLGLDAMLDGAEAPEAVATEFDPADEKDIYKLQQHMANLATDGKAGKFDKDVDTDKEGKFSGLLTKYPQLNPAAQMQAPQDSWAGKAMGMQPTQEQAGPAGLEAAAQSGFVSEEQARQLEQQAAGIEPTVEAPEETEKSSFNKPLFQFGADLLMASQNNDFFGSMGLAGAAAGERADEQETKEQAAARQRFEDSIKMYQLEQKDRQIANNEKWQAIQAAQGNNPYKQQLDQLKVLQAMQKLSQDPQAKMKVDAWKAMQQNPMAMNTPEGKQLNAEVMKMLMSGGGDMTSGVPAPPADLFDDEE